jgi:ligand-binding sensor domain-containing protein
MTRLQQRLIILLLLALLGAWVGVNWGRFVSPREEAFLGYLKESEDYFAPAFPVTLYPTNGPFGVGIVSAIAAGKGGPLYIGTYGGGLFKSDDGGQSWRHSAKGMKDDFVVTLVITPDQTVYAGTIRAGLYKSLDRGESWVGLNDGLDHAEVRAILPLPDGRMYAGTLQGIYASEDAGLHWRSVHTGMQPVLVRSIIQGNGRELYMGTQGLGIFKTSDPATGWTPIADDFFYEPGFRETVVRSLIRDGRGDLYAGTFGSGIFKSRNGGKSWNKANEGLGSLSIRALVSSRKGFLYAGTGRGVFESRDGGRSWREINQGLSNRPVESLAVGDGESLYVGTGIGIYGRRSEGAEWVPLNRGLLIPRIRDLVQDSKGTLYAATDGRGVLKSPDGGKSWIARNDGLPTLSTLSVAVTEAETLYVATRDGLLRRRPKEEEWQLLGGPTLPRVLCVGADKEMVWAGTDRGLYQSRDGGERWELVETVGREAIRQLRLGGEEIFVVSDRGIWAGRKGTWHELPWPAASPPVALSLGPQGRLAAATTDDLYLRNGEEWREIGRGFSGKGIRTVAFDPVFPDILFVGTDRGLFWSQDGGRQWNPAREPGGRLFTDPVRAIVHHPSGVLFLGTETQGVQVAFDQIDRPGWIRRLLGSR